jgi:hypothetical protein
MMREGFEDRGPCEGEFILGRIKSPIEIWPVLYRRSRDRRVDYVEFVRFARASNISALK